MTIPWRGRGRGGEEGPGAEGKGNRRLKGKKKEGKIKM